MNADFIQALEDIEKEKGISKEYMLVTIEAALAAAYKRSFGQGQDVRVSVDREKGDVAVFRRQLVLPDEEELENEENQIHLTAAKVIDPRVQPGMTLAVEPMINMGTYEVVWMDDDWTVVTKDHSLSAHYENTILITEGEPEILSL